MLKKKKHLSYPMLIALGFFIMIIIGALLIIPVALPNLKTFANESSLINAIRRKRKQHPAQ